MVTIKTDQDLFTAAVFFEVVPENQRRVLDINIEDTEETLKHMPGMVASIFHKSLGGGRVNELFFWESEEHIWAALKRDGFSQHMSEVREIVKSDEYSPYELRYVDTATTGPASGAITVSDDAGLLTVVTKFEVEPPARDTLLDVLIEDHEAHVRHLSGFVSVGYLASPDATRVVEYLQFESEEAFEAHDDNPEKLSREKRIAGLVNSSEMDFYEVESISYGTNRDGDRG